MNKCIECGSIITWNKRSSFCESCFDEQLKKKSLKRRNYLIEELLRMDQELYIEKPIYQMSLAELEILHVIEKNKWRHINNYLRGKQNESIKTV